MRYLVAVAFLFCAVSADAARFTVTFEGAPVSGAEVCLFSMTAPDVTCSSADAEVAIPAGDWSVFARKGALISERVESAKSRELTLVRGHRSQPPAVGEGGRLFIYVPRTGSTMPLGPVVPDGDIVPLVVRDGKVARIAGSDGPDVIVPVTIRNLPEGSDETPDLSLIDAKGKTHQNATPAARAEAGATTLAIFRGVAPGAATVKLGGARWKSAETKIEVAPPASVAAKPLVAMPSSKLTVHWWTTVDPETLRPREEANCKVPEDPMIGRTVWDGEVFTASLLLCPDEPNPMPAKCAAAKRVEIPRGELRGQVEFEDVPAGVHFVSFGYPSLPSIMKRVEVTKKEASSADVELRWVTFFGKVTRGGEPVHARVFGSVTDPKSGAYTAVMSRVPVSGAAVFVRYCDESDVYIHVTDEAPAENSEFNIEIPQNRIVIDVVEKNTNAPIADARVTVGAMTPGGGDGAHFAGERGRTDPSGRLVLESMLTNRELAICANHPEYDSECADRFMMKETREKTLRFALAKANVRRGRVVSGTPRQGQLVWFSRTGQITEMIREFGPQGEFTYKAPHAEGEIVVLISADLPLYAFHYPRLADDAMFEIALPAAPRRTFSVTLSANTREEGAFPALQIGDVIVPSNALMWHLGRRRIQAVLRPGSTVTIPDVLETGPITVVLVPFSLMDRYRGQRVEFPLVPEFGSLPKRRLGTSEGVTLE